MVVLRNFGLISRNMGDIFQSPGLQDNCQVPENGEDVGQNHDARKTVLANLSVLSEAGVYFGPEAQK